MILCKLELDILSKLDFRCGNFEKWHKAISRPIFSLVTSLISFTWVPWSKWWWGRGGTRGPILAYGLPVPIINLDVKKKKLMKQNGRHFKFRMILISGHFKTPSNRFSTLKNLIRDILIIQISQQVQKILRYRFFRMGSGGHFENCFPELLPWSSMSTQVYFTPGVAP